MRAWIWKRRRDKAEYWLHCLAQMGDERAERAWYELVRNQFQRNQIIGEKS
jgi:hypothetical protein